MRRPFPRLAAACAFAVAMTAFTGSAFAGNGNGNGTDTAPGQVKKDQAAATQAPAPATQPQQQTVQPQQQAAGTAARPSRPARLRNSSRRRDVGVGPELDAAGREAGLEDDEVDALHEGGTAGATTCTSSDNGHTPQPNADASKKYGNGKTAAQIAVSRGGCQRAADRSR